MDIPATDPMMMLITAWGEHFGYFNNTIDLKIEDLSSFTTPHCTLTAHAPLWGVKEGKEEAVPVADVRKQLARILRFGGRPARHDMHVAVHPNGRSMALFFEIRARFGFVPIVLQRVPLAFVVEAVDTGHGLRISEIHEWAATGPDAANRILVDQHDWPVDTMLRPQVALGALS